MPSRPLARIAVAAVVVIGVAVAAIVALSGGEESSAPAKRPATPKVDRVGSPDATRAVMLAAGDIAECDRKEDTATGRLVARTPGVVQLLGDNAYPNGSKEDYERCYEPTWGSFKERTMPATGNHEYRRSLKAEGYYGYWGARSHPPNGYYSYNLARWHVVVLNSTCYLVGGCHARSPQAKWLEADLKRNRTRCTAAVFHHPRFSSGTRHGSSSLMGPLWRILQRNGGDIVLSGHEHNYERFAPQLDDGTPDRKRGLRLFVSGAGGANTYPFSGKPVKTSESRGENVFGVLRLELEPEGYKWRFLRAGGRKFTDSGSAPCN